MELLFLQDVTDGVRINAGRDRMLHASFFRAVADRDGLVAALESPQVGKDHQGCRGGVGSRASIHHRDGGGIWRRQLSSRSLFSSDVGEVLVRDPQVRRQELGVAVNEALGGLANLT